MVNRPYINGYTFANNQILTNTTSMVFDENNNLFLATSNSIVVIDPTGQNMTALIQVTNITDSNGEEIRNGFTFNSLIYIDKLLYVSSNDGNIYKFNPDTLDIQIYLNINISGVQLSYFSTYYDKITKIRSFYIIGIDSSSNTAIYKYNDKGDGSGPTQVLVNFKVDGLLIGSPKCLTTDDKGNVYIYDSAFSKTILKFDSNANFVSNFITLPNIAMPTEQEMKALKDSGLDTTPIVPVIIFNNNYFYILVIASQIYKYGIDGKLVVPQIGLTINSQSLAVDNNDNLYFSGHDAFDGAYINTTKYVFHAENYYIYIISVSVSVILICLFSMLQKGNNNMVK